LPAEPLHERVEVPEPPVILVDDNVQDRFVELVVTASVTVPEKPLIGTTVIVEVPGVPTLTDTLMGLAIIAKSWTWNTTVAVRVSVPLVPVTVAR
jgi:hypothetical protein